MSARIRISTDAGGFAATVEQFMAAELERTIFANVLRGVLAGRYAGTRFATVTAADGGLIAAAMRTPAHNMLCTRLPDPELAPALIEAWLEHDPGVGGISAVPETARAIASAWAKRTGGGTRRHASMAMHALREVRDPPRPARGGLRLAETRDRAGACTACCARACA